MTTNENADQEQAKCWTLTVDEEGVLNISDEVLDALGWDVMDELEWIDQKDGSFLLVKATENSNSKYTSTIEQIDVTSKPQGETNSEACG
jgi:hypothetical protein